jgi:hypothetical protein
MKQQQPTTTDKEKKMYFTQVHEDAILEYASVLDINRKSELYRLYIQQAFNEMVDKIVYTYKFTSLPNIEDLKDECKIWLTTILDKYDTSKGSKAFSYFSVITKNWFIHKVKKNNNRREIYLEDIQDTADEENLIYEENYVLERQDKEFWENLSGEMDSWNLKKMKSNEEKVYKAIQILFKESDTIEIFNKKAIYLYIREMTGLNTKQVVSNLKKFKLKYEDFKKNWEDGDI